jgi:hypothetical protein
MRVRGRRPTARPSTWAPALAAALLTTALAACSPAGADRTADPGTVTSTSTEPPTAADAGGACLLLDFAATNKALGTAFDVAGAGQSGDTFSCVLRSAAAEYPMMSVALTPTKTDVPTFQSPAIWPKGAAFVGALGKVAYRISLKATDEHGPGVEVTWLSGNDRLITLQVLVGKGKEALPYQKVVTLARLVDQASV